MTLTAPHPSSPAVRATTPRWPGAALALAAVVALVAERVVAAAWDRRAYSYADDYVAFLASAEAGDLQGVAISSPLWFVMATAWITTGVLVAVGGVWLARGLGRRTRRLVVALSAAQAVALTLFAVFAMGPSTLTDGTLGPYLLGAFGSIIFGNALAIVVGLSWRSLGLPRWASLTGVVLGAVGLVGIPATYGWAPIGIAERISVYTFLAWALVTGTALLARSRRGRS